MPFADPEQRRRVAREGMRRRRSRQSGESAPVNPLSRSAGPVTATELAAVLWSEVAAIRRKMRSGDPDRARVVAQLASVLLRVVEASDIEDRLAALESAMAGENGGFQ